MTATTHESCPVHRSEQPFPHPRQGPFTVPATYAEMVEKGVVQVTLANTGLRVWAVTGYDRIRRLLADSRISASRKHDNFPFFFVPRRRRAPRPPSSATTPPSTPPRGARWPRRSPASGSGCCGR